MQWLLYDMICHWFKIQKKIVFHFSQGLDRTEIKFKRVFTNLDKPGKENVVVAGDFPEKWPSFGIEKQKSFHCVTCACAIFFCEYGTRLMLATVLSWNLVAKPLGTQL